jgi:hypothetical protein
VSAPTDHGTETTVASPFTMLGAPDAVACEGDACIVPPPPAG